MEPLGTRRGGAQYHVEKQNLNSHLEMSSFFLEELRLQDSGKVVHCRIHPTSLLPLNFPLKMRNLCIKLGILPPQIYTNLGICHTSFGTGTPN